MDARGHALNLKKRIQNVEYGNVSNKSQSHYGNGGFGRYSFIRHERFPSSNELLIVLNLLFLSFMPMPYFFNILVFFFNCCWSSKQIKKRDKKPRETVYMHESDNIVQSESSKSFALSSSITRIIHHPYSRCAHHRHIYFLSIFVVLFQYPGLFSRLKLDRRLYRLYSISLTLRELQYMASTLKRRQILPCCMLDVGFTLSLVYMYGIHLHSKSELAAGSIFILKLSVSFRYIYIYFFFLLEVSGHQDSRVEQKSFKKKKKKNRERFGAEPHSKVITRSTPRRLWNI
jgi:hypothetical protein